MKLKQQQLEEMRPPLRKLSSLGTVVEAVEEPKMHPTHHLEVVMMVLVARRQQAVEAGIVLMVVLRAQQPKIKAREPTKKVKMEAVWAVVLVEVVVPKLPAKPQTRPRATSRRQRTEIGEGPAAEEAIRIVVIEEVVARKTTRKGKTKTLGSTSTTIWRDLITKR